MADQRFAQFIKGFVFEDIIPKLICLGLAVLVWMYVSDQYTQVIPDVRFDLQFETDAEVAVRSDVQEVSVTLKGPQGRLQQVISTSPTLIYHMDVDPSELDMGALKTIKLDPSLFNLPDGVTVSNIKPVELTVTLGTDPYRYVPVFSNLRNQTQSKYPFEALTSPSEVKVFGPPEVLSRLDAVRTEPIDLANRENDFSRIVKIQEVIDNPELRCNDLISVRVRFNKAQKRVNLNDIPVVVMVPPGYALAYNAPKASLSIELEMGSDIPTPTNIQAILSLAGFSKPGKYSVPIHIINTGKARVVKQSLSSVELTLSPVSAPSADASTSPARPSRSKEN